MKKAITTRRSERSYDGKPLTAEDEKRLMAYIEEDENLTGIMGSKIKIHLVKSFENGSGRIGTYGVVKNASAFLIAVCTDGRDAMLDLGYVFEKLVLYLESIGISTCWLGGTFKSGDVKVPVGEGEFIPIISPVGYSSKRKTMIDRTFRRFAKSDERLAFDELFFYRDFKHSMPQGSMRDALECVRLAPSASNKQPWRVVASGDERVHFYIERTPNYGKGRLGYDIQMVDMGIALSHYEICKGTAEFFKDEPGIPKLSENSSYVMSVK
ncbi:MAG TPA: nitroreductase family protein [Clostridia bacterium]|nr:nitroreductase family protein [Clostridia bacterium]